MEKVILGSAFVIPDYKQNLILMIFWVMIKLNGLFGPASMLSPDLKGCYSSSGPPIGRAPRDGGGMH